MTDHAALAREIANDLRTALEAVLAEPHGCPMCDSGALRKSAWQAGKTHWSSCPYVNARAALSRASQAAPAAPTTEPAVDTKTPAHDLLNRAMDAARVYLNEPEYSRAVAVMEAAMRPTPPPAAPSGKPASALREALDAAKHAMADVRTWLDPCQSEALRRLDREIDAAETVLAAHPSPTPPTQEP